ncbi:MAG: NUDIX domain-containing protein [Rhodopila sp.]|nr:NUDIX domain-containing protein [Rhodopila sp.]
MSDRSTPPIPLHPDVVIESERRVWSGRFPLDVVKFRHRRFDGAMSETRTWELWRRGHASALIPYDPVADVVVLIEQFRFPALAAGIDPTLVELPAGLCEPNEDPADTIRREMGEEMHMEADRIERIGGFMLTPGGADEFCYLYAGRVAAPPVDRDGIAGHGGEAVESEDIRVRVWPADKAIEAAFAGQFPNVITALGLFWLAAKRDWLRQKWMIS